MPKPAFAAGRPGQPLMRVVSAHEEPPPVDDAALVAELRAGAPGAPGLLWDRYAHVARRILRRMLGPSVDVEDALQDVFLRLFRDLETLREPTALKSFLIGIALHDATSELRRRRARRWLMLSDDGALPEAAVAEDGEFAEQRQALHALYRVLDRLDAQRRTVFVLRYVEGLELAELALILDCSLATVKRRVSDAAERVSRLAGRDPRLAAYVKGAP
jgi:RNA polymerase sigma-70 factor (ECF subfamily)